MAVSPDLAEGFAGVKNLSTQRTVEWITEERLPVQSTQLLVEVAHQAIPSQ
jgi:hypothetical protein